MSVNTPTFRNKIGSQAMTTTYNTIVYDYFPLVSIPNRPIFWDARYSMEWASGKVSYEHNKLLSSGIGMTAVEILNKRILGGKLVYKTGDTKDVAKQTTDFIKEKMNELNLDEVTETVNLKRLAGGSSYYVLSPHNGDITLEAIGMDQAYITFQGHKIDSARLFINYIDDGTQKHGGSRYFLVEDRYYKNGEPYTVNRLFKSSIPQYSGASSFFDIGWRDDKSTIARQVGANEIVAPSVKALLENDGIVLGVEVKLPFKSIGVFHVKNTASDLRHPNSKYGRPLLSGAFDLLWLYDYAYSILGRDLHVGRALTFIPSILNGNQLITQHMGDGEQGNAFYNMKVDYPALFDDEFVKLPQMDMEYQAPTNVQFDIRASEIKVAMDDIASKIANQIGISPTYFLSVLNSQNETKTATEVASDMSETNITVKNKRELLQKAINQLIDEVANFYNKNPKHVHVTFPELEEMNKSLTADYIVKLRSVEGMSDEILVRYAYPELSEAEKSEEVKRIAELRRIKSEYKSKGREQDFTEVKPKGVVLEDEDRIAKPDNRYKQ